MGIVYADNKFYVANLGLAVLEADPEVYVYIGSTGSVSNTVPRYPQLSAWLLSESQRLLDQATICRAGLVFRRDPFCVNTQQTILVGHLDSGEGLVTQGRIVPWAGGDIRGGGITLERRGDVCVLRSC